jgi:ribosomal-protein-alanine N-acetyltransferase
MEGKRRGAATALLEVRSANIAAINLYKKTGFQTIGIRPNYYPQTGESALVMSKRLKEES